MSREQELFVDVDPGNLCVITEAFWLSRQNGNVSISHYCLFIVLLRQHPHKSASIGKKVFSLTYFMITETLNRALHSGLTSMNYGKTGDLLLELHLLWLLSSNSSNPPYTFISSSMSFMSRIWSRKKIPWDPFVSFCFKKTSFMIWKCVLLNYTTFCSRWNMTIPTGLTWKQHRYYHALASSTRDLSYPFWSEHVEAFPWCLSFIKISREFLLTDLSVFLEPGNHFAFDCPSSHPAVIDSSRLKTAILEALPEAVSIFAAMRTKMTTKLSLR